MKVTEITVTAGRTFNHPHETYSNLRPEVRMTATLDDSDDAERATKVLQAKAEKLVEDHKNALLSTLEQIYEQDQIDGQIANLERDLTHAQQRLDQLRGQRQQLPAGEDAGPS
jgi:hypothetical protein